MAVYPPPLQYFQGIIYNPDFFTSVSSYITLSYANQNYLTRVGTSLSASSLTQFAGNVTILGLLTISGGINLSGGLTVDNLIVTGTSLFQGQSTFNLIPILPAGFQFITTGSQSITGTKTFNSIPILPAGFQFITNDSQTIDGTKTFNLIPVLPSGFQFITTGSQTLTGSKTFSSVLTTAGINDSLSITSPTITGSTIVNGGTFSASNIAGTSFLYSTSIGGTLACNIINNTSSTLPYILNCGTVPIPTTTSTTSGMGIGWNSLNGGGTGECDLINYGQGGNGGGFNFSTITNASVNRNLGLLSVFAYGGFTINPACGQLRIQDKNSGTSNLTIVQQGATTYFNSNGITTNMAFPVSNSLGALVNVLLLGDNFVATYAPFTPQSTSLFNVFHPTTTLGNNLSTNTTQYATVGYVNANGGASLLASANIWTNTNAYNTSIPTTTLTPSVSTQFSTVGYVTSAITSASLLPLNNLWTGTNQFKNSTNGIKVTPFNTLIDLYFGSGTGNQTNLVIGDYRSYTAVTGTGGQNIAITPSVSPCLTNSTGSSNIAIGNSCGTSQTLANQNIYIGTTCGNNITTGSNNICIGSNTGTGITSGSNNISFGNSAWPTGNTFSNCTVIGASAPSPTASNQIILGGVTETTNITGSANITGTTNITLFGSLPNLPTVYVAPTTTQIGYNFSQSVILTAPSGWVNYPANQLNAMPYGTYQVNACLNLLTATFSTITQYTLTIGTTLAAVTRECAAQMGYYIANGSGSGATPYCITCACSTVYTGFGSNLNIKVWTGTFQANCQLTWNVIRIA